MLNESKVHSCENSGGGAQQREIPKQGFGFVK